MNRTVVVIVGATVIVLFGCLFARLSVQHADATSLTNFVTTLLPILVPAIGGVWVAHNAGSIAASAGRKAQVAVNVAQKTASETSEKLDLQTTILTDTHEQARQAVVNTNGKLDVRLAEVKGAIADLQGTMTRHLEYHASSEEGHQNAGSA